VCGTGNPTVIYKALKKAVSSGRITKARLNESVRRILIMKIRRGLIELP
ncbi:MAG: beta-N-acetylhexosaminidase, partial [Eubacterium sp.]|nr:beta-N-acetylhexosaminidase [Eubacterium sp.]